MLWVLVVYMCTWFLTLSVTSFSVDLSLAGLFDLCLLSFLMMAE